MRQKPASSGRPRRRAWALALGCGALALGAGARAEAQPSPADQAAAEVLFNEARQLLDAGRVNEACPKLLESHRLDPAAGTLLNLGDCYERAGQTASAWGAFQEAGAMARRADDTLRADEARRRAEALEPRLSKLVIQVAPENRALGVEIQRDGRVVGQGLWGSAVPVDPGSHPIEVSAPGRETRRTTAHVPARPGTTVIGVPALVPAAAPDTAKRTPAPGFWSTQRIAGAALGGVGLVGGVVGAIFGTQAATSMSDSEARCDGGDPSVCDGQGFELREDADQAATIANVAFAVGGAALVGGVVLFATAPSGGERREPPQVRLKARAEVTGVSLSGEW
uniref:Membrane protein n=1 Tax=Jahnella sp. MSr9139 TaxID=1434086 RepID=A0A3Q8I5J8_9BACT|nr:membrane protein [Jahnella sp. MSr9139]